MGLTLSSCSVNEEEDAAAGKFPGILNGGLGTRDDSRTRRRRASLPSVEVRIIPLRVWRRAVRQVGLGRRLGSIVVRVPGVSGKCDC
jgi:hypothetical protein